jgi:hypothetical protein
MADRLGRMTATRAAAFAACAALAAVGGQATAAYGQGDDSIDPAWITQSLSSASPPSDVKNNLIEGAVERRRTAAREWRQAVARYGLAKEKARKARGRKRARLLRAARAAKPDPLAKPEYVVVWSSHANASDQNYQGAQDDLAALLQNPFVYSDDVQARFVPGLDGWQVLDARKRNADGSPNPDHGKVVNFVQLPLPWGVETEAHHMQYAWNDGDPILAGGLFNDTTFILGLDDIPSLKLLNTVTPLETPNGSVPDAYDDAGDGHFIGTYMGGPNTNFAGSPGEVVAFKPDPVKGLVVASETPAGRVGATQMDTRTASPSPATTTRASRRARARTRTASRSARTSTGWSRPTTASRATS